MGHRVLVRAVVGVLSLVVVACGSSTGHDAASPSAVGVAGGAATILPTVATSPLPAPSEPTAAAPPTAAATPPTAPPTASVPAVSEPPATPAPAPSATPPPTPALDPPPRPGAFEMDLYRKGDFVSQATRDWCTGAAMQIMLNIAREGPQDRRRSTQEELFELGRSNLPVRRGRGIPPPPWAAALEQAGLGRYVVHGATSRSAAIKAAAKAMRLTGRPVGLVTWRGAHSWVMSGFTATADPAFTDAFKVTGIWTEDPWYPRVSSIWGRSNPPHTLVPIAKLGEDFLPWRRPTGRYPEYNGQYLVVLPVQEAPAG